MTARSVQTPRAASEVTSNISGVQQATDRTGQAAQQVLSAASQSSSQSRDLTRPVNSFLSEILAA